MSEEKRYYIGNGTLCTICDRSKKGSDFFNMLTQFEVVDLLNELNDENEQLKKDLAHTKVLLDSLQDKYGGLLKLVHGSDIE